VGALGGGGDEDLRRGDDLGAGRVVLADPRLVEPEPIEVLDQLQVVVQQHRRVLTRRVERRQKNAKAHKRYLAPSRSAAPSAEDRSHESYPGGGERRGRSIVGRQWLLGPDSAPHAAGP